MRRNVRECLHNPLRRSETIRRLVFVPLLCTSVAAGLAADFGFANADEREGFRRFKEACSLVANPALDNPETFPVQFSNVDTAIAMRHFLHACVSLGGTRARRLDETRTDQWIINHWSFPGPLLVSCGIVMVVAIFIFEAIVLRSSLACGRVRAALEKADAEYQQEAGIMDKSRGVVNKGRRFTEGLWEEFTLFFRSCCGLHNGSKGPILRKVSGLPEPLPADADWDTKGGCSSFWLGVERQHSSVISTPKNGGWRDGEPSTRQCTSTTDNKPPSCTDTIGFTRRAYAVIPHAGVANITLCRHGECRGAVEVTVAAKQALRTAVFQAKAGTHFEEKNEVVCFKAGERTKAFQVKVYAPSPKWTATRWFRVELLNVKPSDKTCLGGPTISGWQSEEKLAARVYLVQRELRFPYNVPEDEVATVSFSDDWFDVLERKVADLRQTTAGYVVRDANAIDLGLFYCDRSGALKLRGMTKCTEDVFPLKILKTPNAMRLVYYFVRDRVAERGKKYWKAMLGILYVPVHSTVVVTVVQKLLLDWACTRTDDADYGAIFLVAAVYMVSCVFLRWGDQCQTLNRGRTGGVRMVHRLQLLSKLCMLDHEEQGEYRGFHWFYAMMQNVESITVDGFWQTFMMCQALFALVLSLATLVVAACVYGQFDLGNFLPSIGVLVIIPVTLAFIYSRRRATEFYLQERMDAEEKWAGTFAWLVHQGGGLFSLGSREIARLESRFEKESKYFVAKHWIARDFLNDTKWVTAWLGNIVYVVMMLFGAIRYKHSDETSFEAGDLVLLLGIYHRFAKHLRMVNESFVKMHRAAVSLRRVASLLNMPEQRMLIDDMERAGEDTDGADGQIELRNVEFYPPDHRPHGMGPMAALKLLGTVVIPLGRYVRVACRSASEAQRLSFLALITKVIRPTAGDLLFPASKWAVLLPASPVGSPPGTNVLTSLELVGAPRLIAARMARILGLDPGLDCERLAPGEMQTLALGRVFLRDPEILVIAAPFAFLAQDMRRRLGQLLRVWQAHGSAFLVSHLQLPECGKAVSLDNISAGGVRRTLVMPDTGILADLQDHPDDVVVDLDDCCQQLDGRSFMTPKHEQTADSITAISMTMV
jgi:ABC-type multidrug transport system fused ATPase/permease subunit